MRRGPESSTTVQQPKKENGTVHSRLLHSNTATTRRWHSSLKHDNTNSTALTHVQQHNSITAAWLNLMHINTSATATTREAQHNSNNSNKEEDGRHTTTATKRGGSEMHNNTTRQQHHQKQERLAYAQNSKSNNKGGSLMHKHNSNTQQGRTARLTDADCVADSPERMAVEQVVPAPQKSIKYKRNIQHQDHAHERKE